MPNLIPGIPRTRNSIEWTIKSRFPLQARNLMIFFSFSHNAIFAFAGGVKAHVEGSWEIPISKTKIDRNQPWIVSISINLDWFISKHKFAAISYFIRLFDFKLFDIREFFHSKTSSKDVFSLCVICVILKGKQTIRFPKKESIVLLFAKK